MDLISRDVWFRRRCLAVSRRRARGGANERMERISLRSFRSSVATRRVRRRPSVSPVSPVSNREREIAARALPRTLNLFLTVHDSTNRVYPRRSKRIHRSAPRTSTDALVRRSFVRRFNSARARPRLSPLARSPFPPFASTCAPPRYVQTLADSSTRLVSSLVSLSAF